MKTIYMTLLLSISLCLYASSEIEIQNPIIRLMPPGMNVTAMFLKITNHTEKDLKVVKVTGDFAGAFEFHNMEMIDGKMKMRSVESIVLKKNSSTELKPGGFHIMIFNLKKPLKEGELHKIKLTLDNKTEVELKAKVEKIN
jgi:copper(I)-binding protein